MHVAKSFWSGSTTRSGYHLGHMFKGQACIFFCWSVVIYCFKNSAPHALTLKIRVRCVKHANGKKDDHLWATAEQNQKESSTRTHRPPPNRDETPSLSSSCENVQEKTPLRRVTATPPNKTSFLSWREKVQVQLYIARTTTGDVTAPLPRVQKSPHLHFFLS